MNGIAQDGLVAASVSAILEKISLKYFLLIMLLISENIPTAFLKVLNRNLGSQNMATGYLEI